MASESDAVADTVLLLSKREAKFERAGSCCPVMDPVTINKIPCNCAVRGHWETGGAPQDNLSPQCSFFFFL